MHANAHKKEKNQNAVTNIAQRGLNTPQESASSLVDHRPEGIARQSLQRLVDARSEQYTKAEKVANEQPGTPVQRVILYDGKQYNRSEFFANDVVFSAVQDLNKGVGMGALSKLANSEKVYDAHNKLAEVEVERVKSAQERRDEAGEARSTAITLPRRTTDYPSERTLFASIDQAIIVINHGKYQFVGTSGLIGCVEVMIEYHTEGAKGYLVAHVSSGIGEDEVEISRQLQVMLHGLSRHLRKEIKWSDFTPGSETHKLTLVRNARMSEQKLLINMRNILSESGAHMRLVSSNSASMEITPTGANYLDNMPTGLKKPPKTDYRREKGYPFPHDEDGGESDGE